MPDLPSKDQLLREVAPSRGKWGARPAGITPESVAQGEESVWDYPRPPEVRLAPAPARVIFNGRIVASSAAALRVVETAGAPVYYFPPADVALEILRKAAEVSICEWKGAAAHYDLVDGERVSREAAFSYPDPLDDLGQGFERIAGWFGFYPARSDECWVGDEKVTPQPGEVYAGWVTSNIKGPIKGNPGTEHW